jgi:hypothetical protein
MRLKRIIGTSNTIMRTGKRITPTCQGDHFSGQGDHFSGQGDHAKEDRRRLSALGQTIKSPCLRRAVVGRLSRLAVDAEGRLSGAGRKHKIAKIQLGESWQCGNLKLRLS